MLTVKKLERFVKTRNKSGFSSNLQFQIDANACGFSVGDLGEVQPFMLNGVKGYQWVLRVQNGRQLERIRLVEFGREIYIDTSRNEDTQSMFELMKKAEFEKKYDAEKHLAYCTALCGL